MPKAVQKPAAPRDPTQPEPKDIVELTQTAAAHVLITAQREDKPYLRVRFDDGAYAMSLDDHADKDSDFLGESNGVKVLVDRQSAEWVPVGLVVDWVKDETSSGFIFKPPYFDLGRPDTLRTLAEARRDFKTRLRKKVTSDEPTPKPPPEVFDLIQFESPAGMLSAYLSPDPKDGKKHPAIIWIHGGDTNGLGETPWSSPDRSNDQSAAAYRHAGIVMMFPAQRGGQDGVGVTEGYLGEADDVIAAGKHLRDLPYVDPERVYLGGHSSGGTLALLVAESTGIFRVVFAFGPVGDVQGYGNGKAPHAIAVEEFRLRAPQLWLHGIRTPTYVIEGLDGNAPSLRAIAAATNNSYVHCLEIPNTNHFAILAPTNELLARKIIADTGDSPLAVTLDEVRALFPGPRQCGWKSVYEVELACREPGRATVVSQGRQPASAPGKDAHSRAEPRRGGTCGAPSGLWDRSRLCPGADAPG